MQEHTNFLTTAVDALAAIVTGGVLLKLLPVIAAVMSIAWFGIRFYEYFRHNRFVD